METQDSVIQNFIDALVSVDRISAEKIIIQEKEKLSTTEITENIISPALEKIGTEWEKENLALSQIYMSGKICEDLVNSLFYNTNLTNKKHPKTAIVVLEDYHLLGKRIVLSMLRSSAYSIIDFGQNRVEELIKNIQENSIKILFISVLMYPSALKVEKLKNRLEQIGYNLNIVVGGAPFRFDTELWNKVGADAMGKTASDSIKIMESFLKENSI